MDNIDTASIRQKKTSWVKILLVVLVIEKIVQHAFVTFGFMFDLGGIRSTVAVSPDLLMIAGAVICVLFALALWGLLTHKSWAVNLIAGLALVDIVGEFIAQGTLIIALNVSFIVAVTLVILCLMYRREEKGSESLAA